MAARSFYFRKPNSIFKTAGLPLQETASTVGEARWQARVLADTAKRGARESGVCYLYGFHK